MPKQIVDMRQRQKPGDLPNGVNSQNAIRFVTFFGDSAIAEDSEEYKLVWETSKLLAENGYGIVDGGGPGVMKAATDGAESVNGHTVAVYWEPKLASIFEGKNVANTTDEAHSYSNYMIRTLGLIEKGQVYVVCRGGTGTISEFGMVWALAKLYYGKHKPVILLGAFWKELVATFQNTMILDDNELSVLHYAETKEDVLNLLKSFELEVQARERTVFSGDEQAFVLSPHIDEAEIRRILDVQKRSRVTNVIAKAQLEDFINMVQPPARVLQIGCGTGHDTVFLANKYSVVAIDKSPGAVNYTKLENPGVDVHVADLIDFPVAGNTYKGIWSRDVLHHIPAQDLDPVFEKLAKGLVHGGILYLIVRRGEGEGTEVDVESGHNFEKFYHYFSQQELIERASRVGLEPAKIEFVTRSHDWIVAVFRKQ